MGLISCRGFGEIILLGEIISAILSVTGLQCYWVVVELPGPVIVFLSVCFFFLFKKFDSQFATTQLPVKLLQATAGAKHEAAER